MIEIAFRETPKYFPLRFLYGWIKISAHLMSESIFICAFVYAFAAAVYYLVCDFRNHFKSNQIRLASQLHEDWAWASMYAYCVCQSHVHQLKSTLMKSLRSENSLWKFYVLSSLVIANEINRMNTIKIYWIGYLCLDSFEKKNFVVKLLLLSMLVACIWSGSVFIFGSV